jgi:thiamine biosynthesis protein ThiI
MLQVTVRYHEIALKGGNRAWFVARLTENLRRATGDLGLRSVRSTASRLVLELDPPGDPDAAWNEVRERLLRVYGVANFSRVESVRRELPVLQAALAAAVRTRRFGSFRVTCKRADKTYPSTSPEICRMLGATVREVTGARVDLEHPELTIDVEILSREAMISMEKVTGAGGLPVGSGGHVVALLSGGIDSPVAAARLMRRGCHVSFVHFHSAPYLDGSSQAKARELVGLLTRFQYRSRLYLVPFGDFQREIVVQVPRPHRVVLYRRMMVRMAERIARRTRAEALVTGESIGQVASQTLRNLATIDAATTMPILRPLVGTDKNEIIAEATLLGTYAISILPDQDCCQLFVPRHPSTRTAVREAEELEATMDLEAACARAVDASVVERFEFPSRIDVEETRHAPAASP